MKGKVYLVGAGPGDPDLLTVKALRVLQAADVVLHDDLISPEILALAPATAFMEDVGKRGGRKSVAQSEINARLVNLAASGLNVVRLKGGDPFIFGRGGEEIEALRNNGIPFEIVPGITAALGAAATAQIPLTLRNVSSTLVFLTGHLSDEPGERNSRDEWQGFVSSNATLVIYMPGKHYENTARRLLNAGLPGDTSCALVSRATTRDERIYPTTVGRLLSTAPMPGPTLLIVGEVTRPSHLGIPHPVFKTARIGLSEQPTAASSRQLHTFNGEQPLQNGQEQSA